MQSELLLTQTAYTVSLARIVSKSSILLIPIIKMGRVLEKCRICRGKKKYRIYKFQSRYISMPSSSFFMCVCLLCRQSTYTVWCVLMLCSFVRL